MTTARRLCFSLPLGLLALIATVPLLAQAPRIDKIEPPDWYAGLPDPMLLIHGEGLGGTSIRVDGKDVTVKRTQASANGHWVFVWLSTAKAPAQTLSIGVSGAAGKTSRSYELRQRDPQAAKLHQGFRPADTIYLIMTDRFADGDPSNNQPGYDRAVPRGWHGGDLRGIEQHLDYLQQLGVNTLWTTPVYSNAGQTDSYHGYAATDLYGIDPHFGTLDDYQHLSAALHARGMKLIMDTVPNHVGVAIPWTNDPPAPDWYHGTAASHPHFSADFDALIDPHAPELRAYDVTHGWFTNEMADMNQENPLVSQYQIENTIWWIETAQLDGLRIDTFPYVSRAFWRDFHQQIHAIYPNLTTVGEIMNGDPVATSFFAGGREERGVDTGLDTPFDYPVCFTLRRVLSSSAPLSDLTAMMRSDALYPHPERLIPFFGNHDLKRFLSEPGATPARLKLAFGILTTLRGMPQFYSGDEIAMRGNDDPDNRQDFPGGFPGDKQSAFDPATRTSEQQEVFAWVSGLLHLRSAEPLLQGTAQQNLFVDGTALAYVRGAALDTGCRPGEAGSRILVVVSKADRERDLSVETRATALAGCSQYTALYPQGAPAAKMADSELRVTLGPDGFAIYKAQ